MIVFFFLGGGGVIPNGRRPRFFSRRYALTCALRCAPVLTRHAHLGVNMVVDDYDRDVLVVVSEWNRREAASSDAFTLPSRLQSIKALLCRDGLHKQFLSDFRFRVASCNGCNGCLLPFSLLCVQSGGGMAGRVVDNETKEQLFFKDTDMQFR